MMLNEEEFHDAVETALDQHDEEDGANDDLVTIKLNFTSQVDYFQGQI